MWTPRNLNLSTRSTASPSMWMPVCSPPFPVVHHQLLGLSDVEVEVVVPAQHCQVTDLIPVGYLIVSGDQAYHHVVVRAHAVVGEQGVQEGTKQTPLWGPRVHGQRGGGDVAYTHHLGSASQEVQGFSCRGMCSVPES
jgi:hypothetical protein